MININELRRLAQAVQGSPRNFHERVNAIHNLHDALPSGVVLELLDRLEAAEKGRDWYAACCEDAMNECGALRTEVESWKGLAQQFGNEADALRAMLQVALDVLDEVRGNINHERGFADELEADVERAIATITFQSAKGKHHETTIL